MRTGYFGGGNGAGPGAGVSSFNTRTGAVVSLSGDYNSGQVDNSSGVSGASVTDALNTLGAGVAASAPSSRSISTTAPLSGGGDLTADRTLSIATVSNTSNGVAPQTNGALGQALLSAAGTGAATWGTDFGANSLTSTGNLLLGPIPRSSALGLIRVAHNSLVIAGRNSANGGDRTVLSWGVTSNDGVTLGDAGTGGTYRILSAGSQDAYIGAVRQYTLGIGLIHFQPDGTVTQSLSQTGVVVQQFFALQTGTIRNISYFGTLNTAGWNSANRVFFTVTCLQAPIAAPAGGAYWYADPTTNALIWLTPANQVGLGNTGLATLVTGAVGSALVGTSNCLRWDTNKLGLYNTAPVVQAARVGQGTNSTGVAAVNRTMSDVTTTGISDPAKVNLNFANLIDNLINPLELLIHNIGLSA